MKDKILVGLVIALVLSLALNVGTVGTFLYLAAVKAKPPVPPDELAERLGLTPEQRQALRGKRDEMEKKAEPIRKELESKRSEAVALLKEPELDTAKRDALLKEISGLQVQLETLIFDHMYETAQVLTPKQKEIFFEHLEHRFCEGKGPFKGAGPHGPQFGPKGFHRGGPSGPGGEFGQWGPAPGFKRGLGPPVGPEDEASPAPGGPESEETPAETR